MTAIPKALLLLLACAGAGCSAGGLRHAAELAMTPAYRPPSLAGIARPGWADGLTLLAGDLHCHVRPPDGDDVTRGVAETVALAHRERLDFLVLTPHVGAGFQASPDARERLLAGHATLRRELARLDPGPTIYVLGAEYTDGRYGHVGLAFADLAAVFAEVSAGEARARPEAFFERFVAHGGVLVINHPFVTPIDSIFRMARADVSWRPWTSREPVPPEIAYVDRAAQAVEVLNLPASELRDRYLLGDPERTLTEAFARLDRLGVAQGRRLSPVGGSDSHGPTLRATTFVWSAARSEAALREALVAGRVCVRSPEACSFEARAEGGAWVGPGGALDAVRGVRVRAHGDGIVVYVNGRPAGQPDPDEELSVPLPAGCSVVRARVGEGYSGPIYVNCPFASGPPGAGPR